MLAGFAGPAAEAPADCCCVGVVAAPATPPRPSLNWAARAAAAAAAAAADVASADEAKIGDGARELDLEDEWPPADEWAIGEQAPEDANEGHGDADKHEAGDDGERVNFDLLDDFEDADDADEEDDDDEDGEEEGDEVGLNFASRAR